MTKLVRNLGMLLVIPLMCILYHRNHRDGTEPPKWYTMIPLFVIGFACMSLIRPVGNLGDQPFGVGLSSAVLVGAVSISLISVLS